MGFFLDPYVLLQNVNFVNDYTHLVGHLSKFSLLQKIFVIHIDVKFKLNIKYLPQNHN